MNTPTDPHTLAESLYEEAVLTEERSGKDRALPLYREIVRVTAGSREDRMRALHAGALSDVAVLEHVLGNRSAGQEAAKEVVGEYLDDPPEGAAEKVADAAFLRGQRLEEESETEAFVALMRRLLDRYGRDRRIAAVASMNLGRMMAAQGDTMASARFYEDIIDQLGDPTDERARAALTDNDARIALAEALTSRADLHYSTGQTQEGDALCARLVDIFGMDPDPVFADNVKWARECLAHSERRRRSRKRWFRR